MRVVAALALLAARARAVADDSFAVAAYLPEWRYEGANWDVIARHATHILLFSAEPSPKGELLHTHDRLPRPELLKEARAAAEARDARLQVCFGGNGRSSGFGPMVADAEARSTFVQNVKDFIDRKKLHGVDYNWEYPGYNFKTGYNQKTLAKDYRGFKKLLNETRAALGPDATISVAYYPDGRQEDLIAEAAGGVVDYFHAMTYDQTGGHHSKMVFADNAIGLAEESKLGVARMTLGLPFYARRANSGDWETYEDLLARTDRRAAAAGPGDDVAPPRAGEAGEWSYNAPATIEAKVRLAKQKGLRGVMIWEAGQDCRLEPVKHRTSAQVHPRTCDDDSESLLVAVTRGRTGDVAASGEL